MLLKSLELQGFKTFPDKTVLKFDRGITAVVGPNGSGKSNISDAVRWVLGEQSTRVLRCSRMEDVVFSGTPTRKAQGYAEVTLTIDNSMRQLAFDDDLVAVTRRYYRSGDSEYLINKAAVRLKDIHELFMDTGLGRDGYSIIGQGKIDSIVAARSEDRREIFEEAAGISRFRYRKEDAERRLNQAEENLLRLRDILSELEGRVGPLKEQAEKAQLYLEYAGERRTLEIGLWLNTLNRSGQILREHDDKIIVAKDQYDDIGREMEQISAEIEQSFKDANGLTAKVDEIRQQAAAQEEEATRKDGDALVLENDMLHNGQNIERLQNEIREASASGENIDREIENKKLEIEEKKALAEKKDEEFASSAKELETLRQNMGESSRQVDGYSRELAEWSAKESEAKLAAMTAASSIAEIGLRLSAVKEAAAAKEQQKQELSKAKDELSAMLREADEKIEALSNAVKGYEMRLNSRRQRAEAAKQQSDQLNLDVQAQTRRAQLLEELERNLEGFAQSVKTVMKESSRGGLQGVHGPVSRLFKVPQEYAVAIETALGAAMQNVVVGTEQDAKKAIQFLKQRDGGRATFLPLSTIRGNELQERGLDDCLGFVGVASQLCNCEEKYHGILKSLLGRIAVAEDLDSAVAIAKRFSYRFRVVTLDGQVVNAGGSLTGGSLAKNSGLLSRASEIERIKAKAEQLREKAAQAGNALKAAVEEASAAEAALTGAKGELASGQEDRFRLDAELNHTAQDLESAEQALRELAEEETSARARQEDLKRQQEAAQKDAEQVSAKMEAVRKELDNLSGNRDELNRRSDELTAILQELRFASLSAQKDREALLSSVADMERRKLDHAGQAERLKKEIQAIEARNAMLAVQADNLKAQAEHLRASASQAKENIEQLNAQRMEFEKQSVELRAKERDKSAQRESVGHELARLEERKGNLQKEYDEIISRLWEEYELTRREAEEVGAQIENVSKAQKRLNELKSKIKALGTVNVAAVEEYREVSERYEFMTSQIGDVEKSRDELRRLIGDLTHQMKELFLTRFAQINENFVQTFRELFGGGAAALALNDPEDILNTGIEISVQPPGKIVTHLELLSGGEKALVAIALYFAIMKVSPPPFCVLDEIEAALDDVNVDRFATYLRRMNDNTQFIVITHRRGTMEEADVLYGVTMQDEGVSKLLELRASEIEKKLGMKQVK